jgi:hypothetical protein
MGSTMHIGCEHRYPKELRELTPLEEKLISLNAAYGFITKFNVQRGQQTGPTYRKHVVGHISVFPNDVESLAVTILPHRLVSALDQVHVIWTGPERPRPLDVTKLLTVRPGALRTALQWLRVNNPLYANIEIDEEEMQSWLFEDGCQVPSLAYQRMVREQETTEEAIRTAQIVPPTDRGQDLPAEPSTVEDIATELAERSKHNPVPPEATPGAPTASTEEAMADETEERVFELRSSAMFPIDDQAAFAEQDELEFISLALQTERESDDRYEATAMRLAPASLYPCRSMVPRNDRSSGYREVVSSPTPSHPIIFPRRSPVASHTDVADHGWRTATKRGAHRIRYCGI